MVKMIYFEMTPCISKRDEKNTWRDNIDNITIMGCITQDNDLITHDLDNLKTFHSDKDQTSKRKPWA